MLLANSMTLPMLARNLAVTHLGDVPSVMAAASVPSSVLHVEVGGEAFGMFAFAPVGGLVALLGVVFVIRVW